MVKIAAARKLKYVDRNDRSFIHSELATRGSVTVSFVNRGNGSPKVRLARGTGGAPAATDYLEYDATVSAGTPLIRSGIPMSSGDKLWARCDTATVVTVQVEGVEA